MSSPGEPLLRPWAGWTAVRLGLAAAIVLLSAAVALLGTKSSSWDALLIAVDAGKVTGSVQVVRGLPPGAQGYGQARVNWSEGARHYQATVTEVDDLTARTSATPPPSSRGSDPVVPGGVRAALTGRRPSLKVEVDPYGSLPSGSLFGWAVPGGVLAAAIGIYLVTFVTVVTGPEPWRATRWAWFWFIAHPVGALAFLLLSGPTPLVPAPRDPARRLSGWWAWLIATVLGLHNR